MKKEMLINVLQPEECRIAIVEDGVLEELYVERTSQESYVGNIYKGRIVNIEPSIQAAFVDFGIGRNGFLHVSDVEPAYYRHLEQPRGERGGRRGGRGNGRRRPHPQEETLEDRFPEPEALPDEAEAPEETAEQIDKSGPREERRQRSSSKERPRGRGRGRGRGRSRRGRRGEEAEAPAGQPGETAAPPAEGRSLEPDSEPAEPGHPETTADDVKEPPRFMDSAERRTEEDEGDDQTKSSSTIDDADLFFPRPASGEEEAGMGE